MIWQQFAMIICWHGYTINVKALLFSVEYWNDEDLHNILLMTRSLEDKLKPFGEIVYNEATIAYFYLWELIYVQNVNSEDNQNAPLYESYQVNSFIYRQQETSILFQIQRF